jgi:hypothetical protein
MLGCQLKSKACWLPMQNTLATDWRLAMYWKWRVGQASGRRSSLIGLGLSLRPTLHQRCWRSHDCDSTELSNVELILDDAYSLGKVRDGFDGGFHFQWISHVPRARLQEFLGRFHGRLSAEAVVVFGDNKDQGSQPDSDGDLYQERRLPDGSCHRVIKNWLTRDELHTLLNPWTERLEFQEFGRDWFVCYQLRA